MFIYLLCWMTLPTLDYWHHSVKCIVGWRGQVKCRIRDRYIRLTTSTHSAIQQCPWSWSSELKHTTWYTIFQLGLAWPGLVSTSSGQVGLSLQQRPYLQRNWITWMFDNHFWLVDVSLTASHKSVYYKEMKHFLRNSFCVWATEIPKPCTWATPGPREYVAALQAFGFCSQPTPPIRRGRRRDVGWIGRSSSLALE